VEWKKTGPGLWTVAIRNKSPSIQRRPSHPAEAAHSRSRITAENKTP
jgi:hypothetical protein